MYSLIGFQENVKNIFRLAHQYAGADTPIRTTRDLQGPYIDFLQSYQPAFPIIAKPGKIIDDIAQFNSYRQAFSISSLNDLNQESMIGVRFNPKDHAQRTVIVQAALQKLKEINRELYELFDLSIHSILLSASTKNSQGLRAHGGTSSKCIGLMWLTLNPKLSQQDILEMLIHELTHTLIFLDERNHEQFDYQSLPLKQMWAHSAILNRTRPMDKVVHSILVSTEIILARRRFLPNSEIPMAHPKSTLLVETTLKAIDSVLNHERLNEVCKPRAIDLVAKAKSAILISKGA